MGAKIKATRRTLTKRIFWYTFRTGELPANISVLMDLIASLAIEPALDNPKRVLQDCMAALNC